MARVRSPGYPGVDLEKAIDITKKIYAASRTNPIDRDAAVKDMGYSGITGASGKMLANLLHYGLVEKAGKGGVRVSALAVDILHPESVERRKVALQVAAFTPELFDQIRSKFTDGVPSENALRSYLMRSGFSDAAVNPAVNSFLETCRFLQQENAYESNEATAQDGVESPPVQPGTEPAVNITPRTQTPPSPSPDASVARGLNVGTATAQGERIVFVEEGALGQYLRLAASGDIDDYLLEALEDYVKRQRRRLSKGDPEKE